MTPRRLGIFGGSFDPVHNGHLAVAIAAYRYLLLDQVCFVPAACSPLKGNGDITPASDRIHMLEAALAPHPFFSLNRCEIDRPPPSFTIDTLEHLQAQLPVSTQLFFLIGADAFLDIGSWKEWRALFQMASFVVFPRGGVDAGKISSMLESLFLRYMFDPARNAWAWQGHAGDMVTNHRILRPKSARLPNCKRLQGDADCGKRDGVAYRVVRETARSPQGVVPCDRLQEMHDVLWVPMDEVNISATMIRSALGRGKDVSDLVSANVANYITSHHLYR